MPAPVISGSQVREALRKGDALGDATVRKVFIPDSVKAEGEDGERTYTFTISTGAVDRERDVIAIDGWQTENFLKAGGPVLWAHDSFGLPIGRAPWVKVQGGALKARVEFAPASANPLAEQVRQLVEFGAIRAASVGFRPLPGRAAWNEERNGIDFLEQELLEFSIVPVPANPEALLDAKAAGIEFELVRVWAEKFLDSLEPGLWLPKDAAQRALMFGCTMMPKESPPAPVEDEDDDEPRAAVCYEVTEADIRAAVQDAVKEIAEKAVRLARGRLD
jgi:HK97 family phage prohead protease